MGNLYNPTFRSSNIATPDISSGAQMILQGLGAPGKISADIQARERLKLQDARQLRQDALATPGSPEWLNAQDAKQKFALGTLTKEQAWKMENDPVYKAKIDEINLAEKDRKDKEFMAGEIMKLPANKTTSTTTGVVTQADVNVQRDGLLNSKYETAGKTYADEFARLTTPLEVPTTPTNVPGATLASNFGYNNGVQNAPNTPNPVSKEEAHQLALQKAGLSDNMVGKEFTIDTENLKKISKGTVKDVVSKLSDKEITQGKMDLVRELANEGKIPSTLALQVIDKMNVKKTNAENIAELEFLRKLTETNAKVKAGYWDKDYSSKSGKNEGIRSTMQNLYEDYGSPDLLGTGDQGTIENALSNLQNKGYSDSQMKQAINLSRGAYGSGSIVGVDEDGFIKAVENNLMKISK